MGSAGRDQLDEDSLLGVFEDERPDAFTDAGLLALDGRASEPTHRTSQLVSSMRGQTAAVMSSARSGPALSTARSSSRSAVRSAALRSTSARTWIQGGEPARRIAVMCAISASVSPSRRARPMKASTLSVSGG